MARKRATVPLAVFLNGRRVGLFTKASTGAVDFQYDANWLGWNNAIPVSLSLPLREDRFIGEPVSNVFDNLLPDNDSIRRRLAERTGANGTDAYSLLAALGRDCVGALQFLPDGADPGPVGQIESRPVDDREIAHILDNLARNPLGISDDEAFRISIAGAQEKTALLYRDGRWHVPIGTTPTTHILKPQLGHLPNGIDMTHSVENEHFCMTLLANLGVPVARTEIADFEGRRVLVVERFDRLWARDGRLLRIPQEDCCQALSVPPSRKYQNEGGPGIAALADLMKGSDDPAADRALLFKAQLIFWLLAAIDGHAKNFSIRLDPGGRFRMTPLYDVMSAQPAFDAKQIRKNQLKLAMSVGDNRHYVVDQILPRHFLQTSEACGLPKDDFVRQLSDLKAVIQDALDRTAAQMPAGFPAALTDSIRHAALARLRKINAYLEADAIDQ
jgi:serine/threonine-protein kinase HipA